MSDKAKKYLEENYSNHNSWGLYPLSEDGVAKLMQSYADQQLKDVLEGAEKEMGDFSSTGLYYDRYRQGQLDLLTHLKQNKE